MQSSIDVEEPSLRTVSISNIIERPPGALEPFPGNPRKHSAKQLAKLKASIQKFGFTAPVLIDEADVILSGHGRVLSAHELKLATIPTRVICGLSESDKRAYVIADNKLALLSSWDLPELRNQLQLLIQDDFSVGHTAFDTAEIDLIVDPELNTAKADDDDLKPSDAVETVTSRLGDHWQLGKHVLACGNALDAEALGRLLRGEVAQMVITDPPYNVPINGHVCGSGKVQHAEFVMASGEMSSSEFTAFLRRALANVAGAAQESAIHYVFMDWRHSGELMTAAAPIFGPPKQLCVWVKDNAGMGTFYRSQHELVFVFKKGDAPHINNFELGQQGRYRTNVWQCPGVNTLSGKGYEWLALHPTVKPTALIVDAIRDCSHRNGIVLDPFAGSGTILVAAERTGRCARAMELDPKYVDVAIQRWQRVTGGKSTLAATGQTWEQVRAERLVAVEGAGHGSWTSATAARPSPAASSLAPRAIRGEGPKARAISSRWSNKSCRRP